MVGYIDTDLYLEDADGLWRVVRFFGWTDTDQFCDCKTPVDEWPESGWQVFAAIYVKDGAHRATTFRGLDTDPTIYRFAGREFIGTMLPDDDYEAVCRKADAQVQKTIRKLDAAA